MFDYYATDIQALFLLSSLTLIAASLITLTAFACWSILQASPEKPRASGVSRPGGKQEVSSSGK